MKRIIALLITALLIPTCSNGSKSGDSGIINFFLLNQLLGSNAGGGGNSTGTGTGSSTGTGTGSPTGTGTGSPTGTGTGSATGTGTGRPTGTGTGVSALTNGSTTSFSVMANSNVLDKDPMITPTTMSAAYSTYLYKISAVSGQSIVALLTGTACATSGSDSAKLRLVLFNSSGTQVSVSITNGFIDYDTSTNTNVSAPLLYSATSTGDYYLWATAFGNSGSCSSYGLSAFIDTFTQERTANSKHMFLYVNSNGMNSNYLTIDNNCNTANNVPSLNPYRSWIYMFGKMANLAANTVYTRPDGTLIGVTNANAEMQGVLFNGVTSDYQVVATGGKYYTNVSPYNCSNWSDTTSTNAFSDYSKASFVGYSNSTTDFYGKFTSTGCAGKPQAVYCGEYQTYSLSTPPSSTRPTITNISPTIGNPGSTITITGTNFSSSTSGNTVYFGKNTNYPGTVTAATTTSLTVTVPSTLPPSQQTYQVSVSNTNGAHTHATLGFKAIGLRIFTSFPISAALGSSFNSTCNSDSNRPDTTKTYKALLYNSGALAPNTKYYARDGYTFLFTSSSILLPPSFIEAPIDSTSTSSYAWYGSITNSCLNWTTNSSSNTGLGAFLTFTTPSWGSAGAVNNCNLTKPLLCVEQSAANVQVTSGSYSFDSGIPSGWSGTWMAEPISGNCFSGQCVKSPAIVNSTSSNFSVSVTTGAGSVTFYRKVSSESGFDYCKFTIDGNAPTSPTSEGSGVSGTSGWVLNTYTITAGNHYLNWTYTKDSSNSAGSDKCWVDSITLP